MSSQAWAVGAFLLVAILERLYERQFSARAERGEVTMGWSYLWFHLLHAMLYISSGLEFVWWRQGSGFSWWGFGVGVGLFGLSLWLRLTAIHTLGRMWSLNLEIRQGHKLVQAGVYRWMRHPAYTAIMLEVVAIPVAANAWWSLVLPLGLYVPLLLARWWREEQEMCAKFGDAYRQYRRQVWAFVPVRRLPPPSSAP